MNNGGAIAFLTDADDDDYGDFADPAGFYTIMLSNFLSRNFGEGTSYFPPPARPRA